MRRAFAGVDLAALDPFVHMDQMGEVDYAPGGQGHPLAPHRGFETVTYMLDGILPSGLRRRRLITDGDTQWMTGGGILSSRRRRGGGDAGRAVRLPALGQPAG